MGRFGEGAMAKIGEGAKEGRGSDGVIE